MAADKLVMWPVGATQGPPSGFELREPLAQLANIPAISPVVSDADTAVNALLLDLKAKGHMVPD